VSLKAWNEHCTEERAMRRFVFSVRMVVAAMTVAASSGATAQAQFPFEGAVDPAEAAVVTTDVHNFVKAHHRLASEADTLAILQADYLDRGSPGLRAYIGRYDLTAERLRAAIREHPDAYAALSANVDVMDAEIPAYREAYAGLKRHIPGAVFPPTYLIVGGYRGIGTGSEAGPIATVETRGPKSLRGTFTTLLVHEMAHMQQAMTVGPEQYQAIYGPERTVLAFMIREGSAEYFADLVTGRMTQEKARPYVIAHERELWERFAPGMLDAEDTGWMWSEPQQPGQPRGVGYVMGALITRAYYDNADDKELAIREILAVTDYPGFLERSGYDPQ
jgi:hypothetical protein